MPNGEVLRPSILWNDQRTQAQCDYMTERIGADRLLELTGNPAVTGFTAPKILWVRDNEPEVYAKAAQVLLPKDYIRYKLTDTYATDLAGAAGTSLLNVAERAWSAEVLDALEISRRVAAAGARRHGNYLDDQRGGRGGNRAQDGYAGGRRRRRSSGRRHWHGLRRAGCDRRHRRHIGRRLRPAQPLRLRAGGPPARLLPRRARYLAFHGRDAQRGRQPTMVQGQRSRHELDFDGLLAEAADLPAGSEGLFFLPYLTGERTPHPDPLARGAFIGMTTRHSRGHLTRAVLEGVAFGLKDSFTLIDQAGLPEQFEVRISGGGAKSPVWQRIIADVLAAPLVNIHTTEGGAFGAAILASVAAGVFDDAASACEAMIQTGETVAVGADAAAYAERYEIYQSLYPTLKDTFARL